MKKKGKDQKAFPGAASAAASALLLTVMAALVFCALGCVRKATGTFR